MRGWRIPIAFVSLSLLYYVAVFILFGFVEETVRACIRVSARTSFIFFCLAFVASSLQYFWKCQFTFWLLNPEIKIWGEEGKTGYHKLEVQNNGIGIASKHLNKIFNMFEKLHADTRFAGTGIGLAVCQKVAFIHNGTLEVDSEEGVGTTFTLQLPKEVVTM